MSLSFFEVHPCKRFRAAVILMAVFALLLCLPVRDAQSAAPGTAEGYLWNDLDRNGIRPIEGEPPLANWTVHLHQADGTLASTTQTDGTGLYRFTALAPGNYYIVIDTKIGWAITQRHAPGSTEQTRSDIYGFNYPFADPAQADRTNPGDPRTTDVQLVDAGNGARWNGGFYQPEFNVTVSDAQSSWNLMRDVIVVDIRTNDAFCLGAVPCSLNYTFVDNYLADNLDDLRLEIDPSWTPGDEINAIVGIVDANGQWSTVATQYLRNNGFVAAYNIVSGMDEWTGETISCLDGYPHADAGPDGVVFEGQTYLVDGTGSSQTGIHSYAWLQLSGPAIALSDPNGLTATFVAPPVAQDLTATFVMSVETHNYSCQPFPAFSNPVVITIQDNGITQYPADVTSFFSHNGHPVGIRVNSGGALVSLAPAAFDPLSATTGVPDHIPYELLEFVIKLDPAHAQANVTFFFPDAQPDRARWYKYTSEGKWVLAGQNATWSADGRSLNLDLVDGGPGDEGGVDGLIRDPGGLGYFDVQPAPPAPPYEPLTSRGDDSGSSSGCFINTLKN
ncbi:MAG: SdrD B-like domain-containing protein [Desulfatibacillaceae bacterium]|nr:SdrD B-like domain-containing protein [Desulfatibacillaceae bacterium]